MAKKQKVIFVLPHTFEPFFKKIKEDIMNVKDLDHFSTRYLSFMVKSTKRYDFEFFIMSSKIKKPLRVMHKNGFYIHVFPRDFPSILPLETSISMLREIKRRCRTGEDIIWHVNSYYMIMSDPISFLLRKENQSFALHHRGAGFSVRTLPYSIYKYWIMNPMIFRRADIVVAENRDEERKLLNNYRLSRDKVMYAPNPVEIVEVNEDKRVLRKKLGLPQDKTIIVYAGRIMKGKGITFLFNSLKPFLKKEKGLFFLMIGDGPQRSEIEAALKQEGIGNAKMVLWVTREVLFSYLKACDLFVHPNRNEKFEGTPNALVEAQGAGLPVVGFDIGGVRDIVKEGRTGGLEKTKDMDAFAAKIVSIAKDRKKLLEMSRNSRKNYDDNYDSSKILKSYELLYSRLIESQKQKKEQLGKTGTRKADGDGQPRKEEKTRVRSVKKTPLWAILMIVLCTFFAAGGQYFIKRGMNQMPLPITLMGLINFSIIFGFFLYAIGAVLMVIALRAGSLSVLYPLISLGFIWVAFIGTRLLGETLSTANWIGILSIIVGCSFIGLSEKYD